MTYRTMLPAYRVVKFTQLFDERMVMLSVAHGDNEPVGVGVDLETRKVTWRGCNNLEVPAEALDAIAAYMNERFGPLDEQPLRAFLADLQALCKKHDVVIDEPGRGAMGHSLTLNDGQVHYLAHADASGAGAWLDERIVRVGRQT